MSRFVLMQGPFSLPDARHHRSAREWRVAINGEAEPAPSAGKTYRVKTFSRAVSLAASMALDRRLPL
jgi:hypothetical protein